MILKMWRLGLVVLCVTSVVGSPPLSRSAERVGEFKKYLERTQKGDGRILDERMALAPNAKEWENSGRYQGDIVLDETQVQGLVRDYATGRNAYIWPNTKWPDNTIVWEFGEGELDAAQQEAVYRAIEDIEHHTCVRFRYRLPSDSSYVRVTGFPDGCYAHVGYWASRGVHIFNLARSAPGTGCFRHTTIVHEWLHIIGFLHMQSTYNRDDYVRVMWENIQPGMEHNFDIYPQSLVSNLGLEYEYTSTMHYGPYGFTINGQPTLVAIREHEGVMGQQEYVTSHDWLRTNRHYNCPGAWD